MPPKVVVSRRGVDRIRSGHPWIYRSDVVQVHGEPGDIVRVVGEHERQLGFAFFSSTSQITRRLLGPEPIEDERAFFRQRLDAAIRYRASLNIEGDVCRLVNG